MCLDWNGERSDDNFKMNEEASLNMYHKSKNESEPWGHIKEEWLRQWEQPSRGPGVGPMWLKQNDLGKRNKVGRGRVVGTTFG